MVWYGVIPVLSVPRVCGERLEYALSNTSSCEESYELYEY